MNLFLLAEAAEFVETNNLKDNNSERDHGYALSFNTELKKPFKNAHNKTKKRSKSRKVPLTRTLHNELEKKRRANMRQSQQELRAVVPQCQKGVSKHTMLSLLVFTRKHIMELNEQEQRQACMISKLQREECELRKRCKWLLHRGKRGHSVSSESSSCSASSFSSHGSNSPVSRLESISDKDDSTCDNLINILDDL